MANDNLVEARRRPGATSDLEKEAEEDEDGRWEGAEQLFPGSLEDVQNTPKDFADSADGGNKLSLDAIRGASDPIGIKKPREGEVY